MKNQFFSSKKYEEEKVVIRQVLLWKFFVNFVVITKICHENIFEMTFFFCNKKLKKRMILKKKNCDEKNLNVTKI